MIYELKTRQTNDDTRIAGVQFRNFRGEEDYPIILEIYRSSQEADGFKAADTLEDFSNSYNHLTRCNLYTDLLMADVDGENIAYARCWWDEDMDGKYRYSFFVNMKPAWRGQGIENQMAQAMIDRLKQIASQHPAQAEKYFQAYSSDAKPWHSALLEHFGFEKIRYGFWMSRPCSMPVEVHPLPDGIEVRTPTPEEYRKVWEADHEAFRDHFGYAEPGEERYQAWLKSSTFNPALWKVAWDGEEIAGMVLNFIDEAENKEYNRKRGYTEDISTRRSWRRQGIARALLSQSVQMFQQMGMEETALGVDAKNPTGALKLYESMGYQEYRRSFVYRKPMHDGLHV